MKNASLRKIIFAALMAALTTVATMIIRIPTPTQGYIHLGDGMVLLCGALLHQALPIGRIGDEYALFRWHGPLGGVRL